MRPIHDHARPNILFIMADQMRADALGIVNGWTRTPNLDRLAREGIAVRGAVTNSPTCIPARLSHAVGLYPHQTGVTDHGSYTLDPRYPTWMRAVSEAGYRTSLFGKTHLHPHEGDLRDRLHLMHAYGLSVVDEIGGPHASASAASNMTDVWQSHGLWELYRRDLADRERHKRYVVRPSPLGLDHHYDVYVGRRAASYLAGLDEGAPWCCWVSFGGPHEPWDTPEPYASLYADVDVGAATPRLRAHERVRGLLRHNFDSPHFSPPLRPNEVRALRADYAGAVTLIDDQIGAILDVVRGRGELDRTVVLFTSDHGEMNGDQGLLYKGNFLDQALMIPLIVRPPPGGCADAGRVVGANAELMDVGATIADYAGASLAGASQARSLRPLVEGRSAAHRDFAVAELRDHTALVDQRWKLELDPADRPTLLFDRVNDPLEQHNLADDPGYGRVRRELRDRLVEFRAATPAPDERVILDRGHDRGRARRARAWMRRAIELGGRLSDAMAGPRAAPPPERYVKFCHQGSQRCNDDPASLGYRYRSWGADTPICCVSHLVELAFFTHDLFEEHGIRYFILWGTHLGALRHRGIIPWDTDVDIGIFSEDHERVRALAPRFHERGYALRDGPGEDMLTLSYSATNDLHVDIEVWQRRGAAFAWQQYTIAEEDLFPLREHPFYNRALIGPRATPYLLDYYGADCLEVGKKQWIGMNTRFYKPSFTKRFEIQHVRAAPIDLQRDFAAEAEDLAWAQIAYARLARKIRLWKLRTYVASLVTHRR